MHYFFSGNHQESAYILDNFSIKPAAAYSVRKLSKNSQYAIRVRRSSDNEQQDIGFNGVDLDTAALAAFCPSGTGHTVTWYDQSGNVGRNLSQGTAERQPTNISDGSVALSGNRPSIYMSGPTVASAERDWLVSNAFTVAQPIIICAVERVKNISGIYRWVLDTTDGRFAFLYAGDPPLIQLYAGSSSSGTQAFVNDTIAVHSVIANGANSSVYYNGAFKGTVNPGTNSLVGVTLGANWVFTATQESYFSELIIYNSPSMEIKNIIEQSQMKYFGIV